MHQVNVKFNNVEQIKQFVNIIDKSESRFDLGSGQKIGNAKSILGVMALDFSKPLQLRFDSMDSRIMEMLSPFLL